jgi:hypothetical protein
VFLVLYPDIGKKFRVLNHAVRTVNPRILDREFGWLVNTRKQE